MLRANNWRKSCLANRLLISLRTREKKGIQDGVRSFSTHRGRVVRSVTQPPTTQVFGPNLSIWKRQVNDQHLVASVLKPSAEIQPEFRNIRLLTADGRTLIGLELKRTDDHLMLQTGPGTTATVTIALDDIEAEKTGEVSVMPAGQVNGLRQRQEFLDLISYLIAIRDGGQQRAAELQPSEEDLKLNIPEYESEIDHRGMIADWNGESNKRGRAIYQGLCVNCHGTLEKAGSLPTSLRFPSDKFKYGNDPYAMYQTLTHGGGLMVPQTWMVPQQKYDVIHYIREHFLREKNPTQYAAITDQYLASLPRGDSRGPEPTEIKPWITMDYGPMLTTTIEFGNGGKNIAQKAIAIRLDEGPGGIARGSRWMVFEHDTLRMAAAWSGNFSRLERYPIQRTAWCSPACQWECTRNQLNRPWMGQSGNPIF